MSQDRNDEFQKRLEAQAREYNSPPPVPRDPMWARIQASRADRSPAPGRPRVRRVLFTRRRAGLGAAIAALVMLSFALGRYNAPAPEAESPPIADTTPRATVDDRTRDLYKLAAVPVLDRAELLLTQFQHAESGDGDTYSARAADLLVDTRYLMSSPAADDPELRRLLGDLELVLSQIIRYAASNGGDREIVDESMEGRLLLPRLRSTPGVNSDWGSRSYWGYRKVES